MLVNSLNLWDYITMKSKDSEPRSLLPYDEAILEDISRQVLDADTDSEQILIAALREAKANAESAQLRLEMTVRAARSKKVAWVAIGKVWGTSRQAAHEKWSEKISAIDYDASIPKHPEV